MVRRAKAGASQAISGHPLFPAFVALWFGALFGLGSLAVRTALVEAAVLALQADLLIPAAAPPLGMTARIVIALALALSGGLLGALLGRWIARPAPEDSESRTASWDAGPGIVDVTERLNSLIDQHAGPVFDIAEPVPGGAPQILDVTAIALAGDKVTPSGPANRIVTADLATLSHVELIERLAISMERRRENALAAAAAAPDDSAAEAFVTFPGRSARHEDSLASSRPFDAPVPVGRPVTTVPVTPVRKLDPEETEKALRTALAALQRMSGAA